MLSISYGHSKVWNYDVGENSDAKRDYSITIIRITKFLFIQSTEII